MESLVLAKGDWEDFLILLVQRKRMTRFLCQIWVRLLAYTTGEYLARELFYYLKGGQVDYGEEHSKACGHSQFGRVYEQGHYPEWDEDHPIHLVGHSAGSQVVRVLQQMLADKAFKGYENTSENWVLSITSLSGALNGTTRTYLDGMQPEDGKSLMPVCLLQLCRVGVIMYEWLDFHWLKDYYNFGFDHFNMTWRKIGIRGLLDCLLGNAGPFASGDWILPDLTIQGSIKLNSHLRTFLQTYYFSYATKRTTKIMGLAVPSGILGIHPLLFIRVLQMSQWRHPQDVSPPYKGYRFVSIASLFLSFDNRGVQASLRAARLFPRDTCHLPPAIGTRQLCPPRLGQMRRCLLLCCNLLNYMKILYSTCPIHLSSILPLPQLCDTFFFLVSPKKNDNFLYLVVII
ncbi:uncharacterized protein LOC132032958 isoform X3 [Lycium ferocissimum]|uniref:uncharacterized protein LOC132032958 isoform X3 n=1 Tax=Lycium ferocissimum TaxID=112874 RepID=UPI0028149E2C|nr:uncharacterized protein LOC132032958 isoform X3 [Lycium ferocissimum]